MADLLGYNARVFDEIRQTFRWNIIAFTCYLRLAGFLSDLFFDPENRDTYTSLRNAGWLSTDFTSL
jgi:hypothetical protein